LLCEENERGEWDSEVVQQTKRVTASSRRMAAARTCFVHISAVEKAGYDGLPDGAKITYDIISAAARSRPEICG